MVYSRGYYDIDVPIGSEAIPHNFYVMDTGTFDVVMGNSFFAKHP